MICNQSQNVEQKSVVLDGEESLLAGADELGKLIAVWLDSVKVNRRNGVSKRRLLRVATIFNKS
jgi:hypothetical protein